MIPAGLALAVLAVWFNSLSGAFVLDDLSHIVDQPGMDRLMPPDWARIGPIAFHRPVVMLTFALNTILGGRHPAGFHAVNLVIHLAAVLLLFGVVRRTLALPAIRATSTLDPDRTAGAVALLWAVHPLQTESVTYIYQRAESLAALLHLTVLWCAVRAWEQPGVRRWRIGAWTAGLLGMGVKETMAVAPLAVILYDRSFLYPSLRIALRERWRLWAGLAASWIPFVLLLPPAEAYTPAEPGLAHATAYALTQPGVLLHYLRLAVWPVGLVLEEDWPLVGGLRDALPAIAGLAAILVGLALAARRAPGLAVATGWAALLLAPTSSIIPLRDPAVEHRMYLPLAAVVIVAVILGRRVLHLASVRLRLPSHWPARIGAGWICALALLLGWLTIQRNTLYRSPVTLYADGVRHRPASVRGHQNLAWALAQEGRLDDALIHARRTIALRPDYAEGWFNLGVYLRRTGRPDEAIAAYRRALTLRPDDIRAGVNLTSLLREREIRSRLPR